MPVAEGQCNHSDFLYSAFALTIASEIPLPDLPPGSGAADIKISIGVLAPTPLPSDSWTVIAGPADVRGWIPGAGAFRVTGGREIIVAPIADGDERTLQLAIVGPLLGVILSQRSSFVIHASTVVIGGCAVAFCGPSGRGKSTLAAALLRAGNPLLADDMTVVDTSGGFPLVRPGFPRIKLWPDSAAALNHDIGKLPLLHPERTKRSLRVPARFHADTVPLRRCYLLEDAATESIAELSPTQSILSLVKYTYQSNWLHETCESGSNLLQCGALAGSGVVRQLRRRRSFEALPEVIRCIEDDIRCASGRFNVDGERR